MCFAISKHTTIQIKNIISKELFRKSFASCVCCMCKYLLPMHLRACYRVRTPISCFSISLVLIPVPLWKVFGWWGWWIFDWNLTMLIWRVMGYEGLFLECKHWRLIVWRHSIEDKCHLVLCQGTQKSGRDASERVRFDPLCCANFQKQSVATLLTSFSLQS